MCMTPVLETERLLLRPYCDDDLGGLAALCADPVVMDHFPQTLDRASSERLAERIKAHFELHGFGPWSVEIKDTHMYAGFVGLMVPAFEAHFTPCVEVGWRLARKYWGRGYATEAARVSLAFGFETMGCDEIVSMTVPGNFRSRAVMARLAMARDPDGDFDHPTVAEGHPLRRHVLYRLSKKSWLSSADKP
jgi:RimJ/RimL family protein N-acetyltransferase